MYWRALTNGVVAILAVNIGAKYIPFLSVVIFLSLRNYDRIIISGWRTKIDLPRDRDILAVL